jgi:ribosome-associated toxin RatA of RatAB toxin-antitoxin module
MLFLYPYLRLMTQPMKKLIPALGLLALSSSLILNSASAQKLFDGPVDRLPAEERVALRKGNVSIDGNEDPQGVVKYTARILVNASQKQAWEVLTDYGNLKKFTPNLVDSTLLAPDAQGHKRLRQTFQRQVLFFPVRSSVTVAVTEQPEEKLQFDRTEGFFEQFTGGWTIQPVDEIPRGSGPKTLLTYQVAAKADNSVPKGVLRDAFKEDIPKTMESIRQEIARRQS